MNKHIITSLGKGDALMCYGIFVELSKAYDHIYYHVNISIYEDVVRMYKTIPNVIIIPEYFDNILQLAKNPSYLIIGLDKKYPDLVADEIFYKIAGLELEKKWSNFYVERNLDKEKEVYYNILGLKDNEEFIFLHEDIDRQYVINRKYCKPGIKIISATDYQFKIGLFDWLYTIEKAAEIHVIHSVFINLIDLLQIQRENLYFHNVIDNLYGTRHLEAPRIKLKLNWNIIQYKDNKMITRTEIINGLFTKYGFQSYLEIGTHNPEQNFDLIQASIKHGVEPTEIEKNERAIFTGTSDQFFSVISPEQKYDVIFVDGLHTAEQAYIDVKNAEAHLNENGFIVMHDCNPLLEEWTVPLELYKSGAWMGNVYKSFIRLKNEHRDWSCFVIDEDCGCGILTQRPILKNKRLTYGIGSSVLTWQKFEEFRAELLQLISFDEYISL